MRIRRKSQGGRKRFSPLLWVASLIAAALVALGVTGTLAQTPATINNTNNNVATQAPSNRVQLSERLLNAARDDFIGTSQGADANPCAIATAPGTPGLLPAPGTPATGTCSTINKFGVDGALASANPLVPGGAPNVTNVLLTNDQSERGQVGGTLTLVAAGCTDTVPAPDNGALCANTQVHITCSNGFTLGVPPTTALPGTGVVTLADLSGLGSIAITGPDVPTVGAGTDAPQLFLAPGPVPVPPGLPPTATTPQSVACTFTTSLPSDAPTTVDGFTTNFQNLAFVLTPIVPGSP